MTVTAEARTHKNAVLALIQAVANLNVFDAEVPETPPLDPDGRVHPYAVMWGDIGTRVNSSLALDSADMDWPFQVTCVGGDINRCLWAVDKVCAALVDVSPVVAGRSVWPIRQEAAGPDKPIRDDKVQPPRWYVPLLFRTYSTPA